MSARTSVLATGFSRRTRCVSFVHLVNPSISTSSRTLLFASIKVVRFGISSAILLSTVCIRFRAHNSVFNRGDNGKLPNVVKSLSVKSIASCGPATPRFSMVGILWPVTPQKKGCQLCSHIDSSVVSALSDVPRRSSSRSLRGLR